MFLFEFDIGTKISYCGSRIFMVMVYAETAKLKAVSASKSVEILCDFRVL